jgi:enoyl-CoA hydratase/carnithine racemase
VIDVRRQGDVSVVRMDAGENRFQPGLLDALDTALDDIAAADGPAALVLTGTGKYFSNGFDLERLDMVPRLQNLLARILELEAFTVAAINGHAFGAGAMLAIACDQRVMRADRGFWCLPEADINIPFTPGMSALIQARLTPRTAHEAMVTARRYGGAEAAERQIVDHAVGEQEVLSTAVEIARAHVAKAGPPLATIKTRMYAQVLSALAEL